MEERRGGVRIRHVPVGREGKYINRSEGMVDEAESVEMYFRARCTQVVKKFKEFKWHIS